MKIKNMVCAGLALLTQTGFAYYSPSSACYEVDAEFLYWSPLFSDETFAIQLRSVNEGKEFMTNDHYKPAFRVAARPLRNACLDLELRFTYFNSGSSQSASAPTNSLFFPNDFFDVPIARIDAQNHTKYYALDVTDHHCFYHNRAWQMSALWGVHSAWLWRRLDSQGFPTAGVFRPVSKTTSSMWAIGPQFGVGIEHPVWKCLSLCAEGRGSLLVAQKHFNSAIVSNIAFGKTWDITTQWQLLPAIDAKLGANYAFGCGCLKGKFEFGYEFLSYSNALFWGGSTINLETTSSKSLGFHGPYAGLQVLF